MTTLNKNDVRLNVISISIHLILFFSLFLFLNFPNLSLVLDSLLLWDSAWYNSIVLNGYHFDPTAQSNSAFFPGFPFIWNISGLGPIGISILNIFFYCLGTFLLFRFFPARNREWQLLFLANPSIFFFFIPYSESTFLLSVAILFIGIKKNLFPLSATGLICAALTRSVTLVFLPAFLILTLVYWRTSNRQHFLKLMFLSLAGILIVALIQYAETGVWFAFAKAQMHWEKSIGWPDFPLHSWGGSLPLRLDIAAFFVCAIAAIKLVQDLWKRYRENFLPEPVVLFSLLYMTGTSCVLLISGGGSLNSLNRYIFCTPFFYMFLIQCSKGNEFNWKTLFSIIALSIFCAMFFMTWSSIVEARNLLYLCLFLSGFYLVSIKDRFFIRLIIILLIGISIYMQAKICSYFFSNEWVG